MNIKSSILKKELNFADLLLGKAVHYADDMIMLLIPINESSDEFMQIIYPGSDENWRLFRQFYFH